MLATLATQTPMHCLGFASAALVIFPLASFKEKFSHSDSSIYQALDIYYFKYFKGVKKWHPVVTQGVKKSYRPLKDFQPYYMLKLQSKKTTQTF